jgi:hypothetical protein
MTFDAVPPGQHETMMSPTANGAGRLKRYPNPQPSNGMTVNCRAAPVNTHFGDLKINLKSSGFNVMPIPNMMTPKPYVIKAPENHVKMVGSISAITEQRIIHNGKALVAKVMSLFND